MFEQDFYLKLINREYAAHLAKPITVAVLPAANQRILTRIDRRFKSHPLTGTGFNHYRPARYLSEHIADLKGDRLRRDHAEIEYKDGTPRRGYTASP